jgi:hypothetical protein
MRSLSRARYSTYIHASNTCTHAYDAMPGKAKKNFCPACPPCGHNPTRQSPVRAGRSDDSQRDPWPPFAPWINGPRANQADTALNAMQVKGPSDTWSRWLPHGRSFSTVHGIRCCATTAERNCKRRDERTLPGMQNIPAQMIHGKKLPPVARRLPAIALKTSGRDIARLPNNLSSLSADL